VKPGTNDEVRQLADIGPTVLDRLGIQTPDHFIGHSLLRRFTDREPKAFFGNANGGISAGLRMGKYKYFVSMKTKNQHLFDVSVDRQEKNDLSDNPAYADLCKTFYRMVADVEIQNTRLIKENKIWDPHDAVKR
jgi:arylsulfatase A-like enzyme